MKKSHAILIRNGEHRTIKNYFRNNPEIHINYYQTPIPSFGGNYCFTMVSYKDIDVRTNAPNFTEISLEIKDQISLMLTYPLDPPPEPECCCVLL